MAEGDRQRVDKWLFFTRAVKSRSLAAKLVQAGRVRVNRTKIDQPAHAVKDGDVMTITLHPRILVWRVVVAGSRRGPAEEARTLYEDITPAPAAVDGDRAASGPPPGEREAGSGRPTKRERRAIDRMRDDI